MSINGISGGAPIDTTQLDPQTEVPKAPDNVGGSSGGNTLTSFVGGGESSGGGIFGGFGDFFGSLGSIFGGGKDTSPGGFDLGALIGGLFNNPIFKLFEGLFGKPAEPVQFPAAPRPEVLSDAEGGLSPEGADTTDPADGAVDDDPDAAVGAGLTGGGSSNDVQATLSGAGQVLTAKNSGEFVDAAAKLIMGFMQMFGPEVSLQEMEARAAKEKVS